MTVRKSIVSQWDTANEVLSHRQFCRANSVDSDVPVVHEAFDALMTSLAHTKAAYEAGSFR
jgi:hypothetical protein